MSNEQLNHVRNDILGKIAEYGWSCVGVFDPDGEEPSFTYTVGLAVHGGAEYLMAGLPPQQATTVLNVLGRLLESGERFEEFSDGVIDEFRVRFVDMTDRHEAYSAVDFWHGGEAPVRVRQLLWPDPEGHLPGEVGMDMKWADLQRVKGSAF